MARTRSLPHRTPRDDLAERIVVGLDLSLTGTGIAALQPSTGELSTAVHKSPAPDSPGLGLHVARHRDLVDGIVEQTVACRPVLVVVEGLQFSMKGKDSSLARRGFLWWAVIEGLHRAGLSVLEVTPQQIKLYATGKGNASKAEVCSAYAVAWPNAERGGNIEDRADATFAAALGAGWLGLVPPPLTDTAYRTRAVSKVADPSIPVPDPGPVPCVVAASA